MTNENDLLKSVKIDEVKIDVPPPPKPLKVAQAEPLSSSILAKVPTNFKQQATSESNKEIEPLLKNVSLKTSLNREPMVRAKAAKNAAVTKAHYAIQVASFTKQEKRANFN